MSRCPTNPPLFVVGFGLFDAMTPPCNWTWPQPKSQNLWKNLEWEWRIQSLPPAFYGHFHDTSVTQSFKELGPFRNQTWGCSILAFFGKIRTRCLKIYGKIWSENSIAHHLFMAIFDDTSVTQSFKELGPFWNQTWGCSILKKFDQDVSGKIIPFNFVFP